MADESEFEALAARARAGDPEPFVRLQHRMIGKDLHNLVCVISAKLAAINGHGRMDAADHVAVAINRLELAYCLLGYEPPPEFDH